MALITYYDKNYLDLNPNIPDVNKVLDDDMNEIKTVVNTNYNEVGNITNLTTTDKSSVVNAINELKNREILSTNETITNKVWIDGKPIYRKVINTGTISSSDKNVNHNISNLETVVSLSGMAFANYNSTYYVLPRISTGNVNQQIALGCDSTKVVLQVGSNANFNDSFVIVEYTKTTEGV